MTENQSGCFVLFHITLGAVSGGSNAAKRQVIQIAAGFVRTRRKRFSLFPTGSTEPRGTSGLPDTPG